VNTDITAALEYAAELERIERWTDELAESGWQIDYTATTTRAGLVVKLTATPPAHRIYTTPGPAYDHADHSPDQT
jgi:hypothetical protein